MWSENYTTINKETRCAHEQQDQALVSIKNNFNLMNNIGTLKQMWFFQKNSKCTKWSSGHGIRWRMMWEIIIYKQNCETMTRTC